VVLVAGQESYGRALLCGRQLQLALKASAGSLSLYIF
jgi:hypothetical protein